MTERKSEGYFRGEMQLVINTRFSWSRVLLAPYLWRRSELRADWQALLTGGDGQGGLDAACRLEAARKLREMGNGALNGSRLEEASRKYVKALGILMACRAARPG